MSAPETDLTEAEEPTGTTTTTVQSETLSGGQVFLRFMKCYWKSFVTVIVPFAFMPFIYYHAKDKRCIFVFGVMAIFWITQAIPQPITGLLPVLLLPFLGISKVQPVCIEYLREANMMFMGMSLMAFCVQKSGLYKRCALKWMMLLGGSHSSLTLSVFTITAVGSMLFTQITATEMTIPIVMSMLRSLQEADVLRLAEEDDPQNTPERPVPTRTTTCYMLGIAYCANIGGTATVVGSGVNMATRSFVNVAPSYKFYMPYQMWFAGCFLVAAFEVVVVWLWLNICLLKLFWGSRSDRELKMSERQEIKLHIRRVLDDQYDELGPVKATEVLMAIAFIAVILLWIFRSPVFFYGWENGLQKSIPPLKEIKSFQVIKDAGPTIVLVFLLSVLPSKFECAVFCLGNKPLPSTKVPSILEWKSFNKQLHWATFLTIGGGFALFKGILDSKLFDKLNFGFLKNMDKDAADSVILLSFCLLTVVLAQFVSNTALFFIIAPIALRAADQARIKDLYIIVAVGVCCSLSFVLPFAGLPNQIVYKKTKISLKNMALAGIVPLLFCFALTFVSFLTIGRVVLRNTTNVGTGKGK